MKTPSATTRSAARERQLLADRLSKRKARLAYVAERSSLQSAVEALTLRYFAIKGTLLPWHDIVVALRESSDASLLENCALRTEATKTNAIVQRLRQWFQTMEAPQRLPGYLSRGAVLDVTLVAEPSTRRLGYDWISKQLYHGTSVQLSPRLFPYVYEDSIKVEWGVRGRKLVLQKVIQASQEVVAKALWAVNRAVATEAFPVPDSECNSSMKVLRKEVTISVNSRLLRTVNCLEHRAAFESVLDYVKVLYPDLYDREVVEYAMQAADTAFLEQHISWFLLQRAAWIATDYFKHLERVLARPTAFRIMSI
ncbi:hypothetical protein SPRG_15992 [Saprolegnia parasitica CBS 223.65]|uniref:Uncharacterized protein n=1 Tax=Saprolegnia parasitica (strain CBS 223.65) TaxID=695850 RepID=A0A067BPN0_SAPPC|nr:hypothetical protein SPRG_15992 [Saprolegnia parasitica CBS 223.65]KDO18710.1 hypothetical protein SPRG_15992 [Saprolegnia parasitica CBS 223.65]|eukprot:XP_012210587.1 hypothetical protein SPRG_15992 [Saprolegnia parasitica CBS 223.65]